MNDVCLDEWEEENIKEIFLKMFKPEDSLWIFGSRADLTQKGGDIDLYIELLPSTPKPDWQRRQHFIPAVKDVLGDQKIDVVLNDHTQEILIYKIARAQGVKIV